MLTATFDYQLPAELIAQYPSSSRSASRMLVLDRKTAVPVPCMFSDLISCLRPDDLLVFNNTRVMNARLFGSKQGGSARIEVLLVRKSGDDWFCMLKPGKRLHSGNCVNLVTKNGETSPYSLTVHGRTDDGLFRIRLTPSDHENVILETCGHVPLPPYVRRTDEAQDLERYQTIYAKIPGAVAAPTAGLHFDDAMMEKIRNAGITMTEVTLHVGPGTFQPVSVEHIEDHTMHEEWYEISAEAADHIDHTRKSGGRIIAVGTTVVRVLESCVQPDGTLKTGVGSTRIFIHDPYQFRVIAGLLTNFHLPKSTLLMLVCALGGHDLVMSAYQLAIRERFRFYSYGDCMLIL